MTSLHRQLARSWERLQPRFLPFADAATPELPLGRLLRLSMFQFSVGMAVVLLNGTLNRVMIVELGVAAWLVSLMVALPLVFAPLRALIGFRSDHHRSVLGWRRVPYIWMGTLLQFGGLAVMPFALIVLSGDTYNPVSPWVGPLSAGLVFLLVGAGLHTTQTAGLALACDLAPEAARPRVVALLYVMLLVGMVASSAAFGFFLEDFNQLRLIQVIQGAAVATMLLNLLALWKQEARRPSVTDPGRPRPTFRDCWHAYTESGRSRRFLLTVGFGTAAFSMQDILLEPYGAEILDLSVANTTTLTALLAAGTLAGLGLAARLLGRAFDVYRLAALGALVGLVAFSAVVMAAPMESALLFRCGTVAIGFGGGLFAVGTLTAAMNRRDGASQSGLALGAWGAVQATAAGLAIAVGGALRDVVNGLAAKGAFGPALTDPSAGYMVVYHVEIAMLFATLVVMGPLVAYGRRSPDRRPAQFGMAEFPG